MLIFSTLATFSTQAQPASRPTGVSSIRADTAARSSSGSHVARSQNPVVPPEEPYPPYPPADARPATTAAASGATSRNATTSEVGKMRYVAHDGVLISLSS